MPLNAFPCGRGHAQAGFRHLATIGGLAPIPVHHVAQQIQQPVRLCGIGSQRARHPVASTAFFHGLARVEGNHTGKFHAFGTAAGFQQDRAGLIPGRLEASGIVKLVDVGEDADDGHRTPRTGQLAQQAQL